MESVHHICAQTSLDPIQVGGLPTRYFSAPRVPAGSQTVASFTGHPKSNVEAARSVVFDRFISNGPLVDRVALRPVTSRRWYCPGCGRKCRSIGSERASSPEEKEFLDWRYPESEYFRLRHNDRPSNFVIAKKGSEKDYVRVCQYRLDGDDPPLSSLVLELIRKSHAREALGVRWAVYTHSEAPDKPVRTMRKMGFLCVRRQRTLLIYGEHREFLEPGTWVMSDGFTTFDN